MLLGGSTILLATFLAGVVGFAYGLVALPLLLVVGVPLTDVVVINLAVGLVTRISVVAQRFRDISPSRAGLLVAGSLPGIVLGLLTRGLLNADVVRLAAGVVTLLAVAAIVRRTRHLRPARSGPRLAFTAGTAGGFLGVTTSLNGIPPALLLTGDRASARGMVADLAAYFVVGNALTLGMMWQSGLEASGWIWWALLGWIPVGLVGNLLGTTLGPRLPYQLFRRVTLVVIVTSGVVSVVQAVRAIA